jgi:hypothetical protein
MVYAIMYQEDYYVLLQPDREEEFLTPEELVSFLEQVITSAPQYLPQELTKFSSLQEKANYLRDNFCELNLEPGVYLQWYVVRLEKS